MPWELPCSGAAERRRVTALTVWQALSRRRPRGSPRPRAPAPAEPAPSGGRERRPSGRHLGALAAYRKAGIRVPDDVSLAGFDDISTLRDVVPSLTSVRLPLEERGALAAQLALDTDPDGPTRTVKVQAEVVLRDST